VKAVELYDRDFFEWTRYNAALLREGRLDEVDVEHLAEQVEDLAMPFRQELKDRLEILLQHLLKWQFLYEWREAGDHCWRGTIDLQRREIKDLLEDMPVCERRSRRIGIQLMGVRFPGPRLNRPAQTTAFPLHAPIRSKRPWTRGFFRRIDDGGYGALRTRFHRVGAP
jgi:Domain of unknown function DUF29